MDQARMFVAIALSFLVFFLWQMLTVDESAQQGQPAPGAETAAPLKDDIPRQALPTQEQRSAYDLPAETIAPAEPVGSSRVITVETPLYVLQIAERGAMFRSLLLKHYRESVEEESAALDMIDSEVGGTLEVDFAGNSARGLTEAIFAADALGDTIIVDDVGSSVNFSWRTSDGLRVVKTFSFDPDSYMIGMRVLVDNGTSYAVQDRLRVSMKKVFKDKGRSYGFSGPSALLDGALEQIDLDDIEDKNIYRGQFQWMAILDRYFMASLIPDPLDGASMHLFLQTDGTLDSQYVEPIAVIPPNGQKTFEYQLFWGPKSTSVLGALGHNLDQAINFGMFDIIAKPCVWLMNFFYGVIPNYGIAIILLTLLSKILLWPLGTKSYKSMAEMKKVQPLMTEIREKYKNDKRKMNEEVMGLYRTYKINPLGGCLPMVVQIPIFFALYRMLYEAIELRHAAFFGWINDLSAPDRLFSFGFSIPFMQEPYGIPVLTIVMGGTMFLSQKMSPPMGDPAQAKMMMLMPIIFTVIFINFSSGLVLYWLVNNVVSIGQQYYTTKKLA